MTDDPDVPPEIVAELRIVGMELGASVDWDEVAELVTESYRLLAPRRLVEQDGAGGAGDQPSAGAGA